MLLHRRTFLSSLAAAPLMAADRRRPNILLIISDDQGYGDLSLHGNPHLKTPNLDRIARDGAQLQQFQVCPVCSPTRASLMTGRYNYRTGVVDTYLGRSMMHADEVTLPELLRRVGYRTGIFGKWHLGDNYPLRAQDQGFEESLTHRGGGMSQPSDPPGSSYTNPLLFKNGVQRRYQGYCTDVFADAAGVFIQQNRNRPWFAYVATNAPHTPLEIDEEWVAPYRREGLDETTAKVYGMVANLDAAVGRLLETVKSAGLESDTVVIFLTDNGPQQRRYNADMRGLKGSVYQGGIRVPCFVRWPGMIDPGTTVDRIAAHIDLLPTLLELAGASVPDSIDGHSLLPLLRGTSSNWPDRTLFTQWHRGEAPEPFRNSAVRTQQWKLVDGKELYDIQSDPGEKRDLAFTQPDRVQHLRASYRRWFADVSGTRGYAPPRIAIGTPEENPVVLTRQDWRGSRAGWDPTSVGHWEVDVRRPGKYSIRVDMDPAGDSGECRLSFGGLTLTSPVSAGAKSCAFPSVTLPREVGRLEILLMMNAVERGPSFVTVRRIG
jgi:arylsulfatase A-like enzyme